MIAASLHTDVNDPCSITRLRMNVSMPKANVVLEDEDDIEISVIE
jgi:hypothetical protein